jgi:hypothetical protein
MLKTSGIAAAAGASLLALFGSACSGEERSDAAAGRPPSKEISAKDFSPKNFDRSTAVDNAWFPLRPGTELVFVGSTREDGKRIPHRELYIVTDLTKVVAGVRNVVIWDRDYRAGELAETEIALFAQDNDGNVWHLGQYPEEWENGRFVAAPAWFAGLKGARAGIAMKAQPRLGAHAYSQGFAPDPVHWVDRAEVHRTGQKTCVPAGCYASVLVTREFEPDKPESYQLKYYARGVGNVRVGWLGSKDEDHEVLALTSVRRLDQRAMARVRAAVRKLEKHAYVISKDVYARTPPLARRR